MDAILIIEKLGGIRPTATKLGVAISTVQGWKERNKIPPQHMPEIEALLNSDIGKNNPNIKSGASVFNKAVKVEKVSSARGSIGNTFVVRLSLVLSCFALAASLLLPFFIDDIYPKKNTQNIENLELFLQESLTGLKNNDMALNNKMIENGKKYQQGFMALEEFQAKAEAKLKATNEKILLLRQIATLALMGEPYSVLLSLYTLTEKQAKNADIVKALVVVQSNKYGIKTTGYLKSYLQDNARIIAPYISEKNATSIFDKITSRLQSLVYITKISANRTQNRSVDLQSIIDLVSAGQIEKSIVLAKGYDIEALNAWLILAQKRLETVQALNLLLGDK